MHSGGVLFITLMSMTDFFCSVAHTSGIGINNSVVVKVNDRGPNQAGRIVDLSRAAAQQLGIVRAGLTEVRVEVVK
jgi:rare lipoprotein A